MKEIFVAAVVIIASVFVQTSFAAWISVVPSSQTVLEGENFTVSIRIDPEGSEISGAQYVLVFNNTLLEAISQIKGSFLSQDGASTIVYKNEIDNETGIVKYAEARIGTEARTGTTSGVTSPGILATITFEAIKSGIAHLNFSDVKLSAPNAQPIPVSVCNGTCEIKDAKQHTHAQASEVGGAEEEIAATPSPTSLTPSPASIQTPSPTAEQISTTRTPDTSQNSTTPEHTPTPTHTIVALPSQVVAPTPTSTPASKGRYVPGFEAFAGILSISALLIKLAKKEGGDGNE